MMQKKEQEVQFAFQGKHGLDNIFVTENFFFKNEYQEFFLTCAFLIDLVRWWQNNIFLSLAGLDYILNFQKSFPA